MAMLDNNNIELLSSGLKYPEGPIHCRDGSILLVEIMGEQLSIVGPEGGPSRTVTKIEGGPNGAAIGAQGDVLICNDGGFDWQRIQLAPDAPVIWVAGNQPESYIGGHLQSVDSQTGALSTLFSDCAKRDYPPLMKWPDWNPKFQLRGLDDLVVDELGGIWFTDYGKMRERDKDITGLYYVSPDRQTITQKIYPLNNPNGIALSPDGSRLYVALTFERKVVYYDLAAPGKIAPNKAALDGSYLLTADLESQSVLDSMAVDVEGNVYVATMLPSGNNPYSNGGISIISPEGESEFVSIKISDKDFVPLPSNICFGGPDMKTAYITCGGSGHLIKMPSAVAGLELNFNGSNFDAGGLLSIIELKESADADASNSKECSS